MSKIKSLLSYCVSPYRQFSIETYVVIVWKIPDLFLGRSSFLHPFSPLFIQLTNYMLAPFHVALPIISSTESDAEVQLSSLCIDLLH